MGFPDPIPDMAAFRAGMRQPEVQAKYRADYKVCENNPKRGTILKIFEVAGLDPKLVKVRLAGWEMGGWDFGRSAGWVSCLIILVHPFASTHQTHIHHQTHRWSGRRSAWPRRRTRPPPR